MQLCPVCAGEAPVTMQLGAEKIRMGLKRAFGASLPDDFALSDYDMRQCRACSLVFADPMRAGDANYYHWVTNLPNYHAEDRWEWRVVRDLLAKRGPARLLELGCGTGTFLASLVNLKNVDAEGIDLAETSVAAARARGLNARCVSLEEMIEQKTRYDMIFMSHVLEHVEDPLKIVTSCKRLLEPGGEVVFSVPYSPTSREYRELDIMNLPPHHLTRWNMASLKRLAEVAGMGLSYEMRQPKPLLKRAIHHTVEMVTGGVGDTGAFASLGIVLSHRKLFAEALKLFRSREMVGGRRAADEILVRLKAI